MFSVNSIRCIFFDFLFTVHLSYPYGSTPASLPSTNRLFASPSTCEGLDSPNELFTPTIQSSDPDPVIPDITIDHLDCDADSVSDGCSDATTTFSSDEDSETESMISSATSDDLVCIHDVAVGYSYATTTSSFDEDGETESIISSATSDDLVTDQVESDEASFSAESDERCKQVCSQTVPESDAQEVVAPTNVYVASAVPPRVYAEWDGRRQKKEVIPQWVDDIDADDNYDARYLTPFARDEAERRSLDIWRCARMAARDLAKVKPLKAHQHPEPRIRRSPSVLKDLGHSSPLRTSWTMNDVEQFALQEKCVDQEDSTLPWPQVLQD